MLQFKLGDRVRIAATAPSDAGMTGTIVGVHEYKAGPTPIHQYEVDFGTRRQSFMRAHLEDASLPSRFLIGEILERWRMLPQSEVEECIEDRNKLVKLIESRCGFSPLRAERELELLLREFRDKLRQAA